MWTEWKRIHHGPPQVGDYVQIEFNCGFCNDSPYVLEGFYGMELARVISGEEPCDRKAEWWRKLKPNAKEKLILRREKVS